MKESPAAAEPAVLLHLEGPIATLTLNRPKALNAIDAAVGEQLYAQLDALDRDPAIRAVILTGAGRAFCAGGDLRMIMAANRQRPGAALRQLAGLFHEVVRALRGLKKPVIGALNGVAAGGGFSLALACDLRVMAASATMKQAYTSVGLSIDGGGTFTLPRLVGLAHALEIAFLDEPIPAERCLALGLATQVVPDAQLPAAALALAERLARMPTQALARAKALLARSFETDLATRLVEEQDGIAEAADTAEGREGVEAFLEKRTPDFVAAARR